MKFDEQLFTLSDKAYHMVESSKNAVDEETKKKQDQLLKLLLAKFQEQLKSKTNIGKGVLKVKFESRFWSDFNDGYSEIDELVKSDNFDSFASDYCIYISDIGRRYDEYSPAYYEIIWDYKTYFEQLSNYDSAKKGSGDKSNQRIEKIKEYRKLNDHNYGD